MTSQRGPKPPANDNRDVPDQTTGPAECHEGDHGPLELATLDFPAQFLVWALRAWVQAFKASESFDDVTHHGFTRFGLQASALALDGAMTVLAASASRPIDIRCLNCRYLSPDEAILLDAVAAAQAEHHFMATVALRKTMPGTAARIALPHMVDLARDLARAGMRLNSPAVQSTDWAPGEQITPPARQWLH
jgi:hypothetical protein